MLNIFYRRFYILLFLIWLFATAGIFVLSVWGNFGSFVSNFREVVVVGLSPDAENATKEDVVARTADTIVRKVQIARDVVRQEVSREVVNAEEDVEKILGMKAATPDDSAEKAVVAKAEVLLKQPRKQETTGELTAMKFTEGADQVVAHLETSRSVGKVTAFWLSNPTRLVVDLRGDWKNISPRIHRFNGSFLYRVIIGMHPDRLRVVFKFSDPETPEGERPALNMTDDGLDIVVADPSI